MGTAPCYSTIRMYDPDGLFQAGISFRPRKRRAFFRHCQKWLGPMRAKPQELLCTQEDGNRTLKLSFPLLQLDLVGPLEPADADSGETVQRRVAAHSAPSLNRRAPDMRDEYDPFLLDQWVVRRDVGLARDDV